MTTRYDNMSLKNMCWHNRIPLRRQKNKTNNSGLSREKKHLECTSTKPSNCFQNKRKQNQLEFLSLCEDCQRNRINVASFFSLWRNPLATHSCVPLKNPGLNALLCLSFLDVTPLKIKIKITKYNENVWKLLRPLVARRFRKV